MKTEAAINTDINTLTDTMDTQFPELLKYVDEMPITNPDINNPKINATTLNEYYDSLNNLINKYQENKGGVVK
jgi:hypothetical protein